jgi:hypothetical protein
MAKEATSDMRALDCHLDRRNSGFGAYSGVIRGFLFLENIGIISKKVTRASFRIPSNSPIILSSGPI